MSLLVDSLKDRLLLAVPKKGRLHEKCVELLSGKSHLFQKVASRSASQRFWSRRLAARPWSSHSMSAPGRRDG